MRSQLSQRPKNFALRAGPHRHRAGNQPDSRFAWARIIYTDAARHVERSVRSNDGDRNGKRDDTQIVGTVHYSISRKPKIA